MKPRGLLLAAACTAGWLVTAGLIATEAMSQPTPLPAPPAIFAKPWNAGVDRAEPAFQVQQIDRDTYAIRQSIQATFEAPFLYLLFGRDRALLIDSGDRGATTRAVVDKLIGERLAATRRTSLPLVVMHSHGHGDHVGGDAGFTGRPDTSVVGHAPEAVAAFFGIADWPTGTAAFELGGRTVDVLPTPGHHPSHVMVFDRATRLLFSGDTVYPGKLYFQCGQAGTYLASIDRVAAFAARHRVRAVLGAHIEMQAAPGKSFEGSDRVRRDEHRLELPPAVLTEIRTAVAAMGDRPRVETHPDFIVFPHPADPRGKSPPDWCLTP